ncbi:uncharacterized protein si:dkey-288a3.2 isoform X1 [Simochromis diagramma]|uniref:uncharacterized protein si:dkey-288a3.2 isoform X1 n=1 Tax=Simochromis diagramma TaxID=43689 RepID=UPI001A7EFCA6|nr:uncharacterized protein si:dkey-288a3.2 isoform X1 [Simochromis diagramma]
MVHSLLCRCVVRWALSYTVIKQVKTNKDKSMAEPLLLIHYREMKFANMHRPTIIISLIQTCGCVRHIATYIRVTTTNTPTIHLEVPFSSSTDNNESLSVPSANKHILLFVFRGLEELCDGLRRQKGGLKVLLLRNNQITVKGMEHLAKTLPVLKVLQVLDLSENLLGNEGIQIIREPLMVNNSVLQLGLAQASITCEGTPC